MQPVKPKLSILIAACLMVGLMADLMPHPNLGPSLLTSMVNGILQPEAETEAVRTASTNP